MDRREFVKGGSALTAGALILQGCGGGEELQAQADQALKSAVILDKSAAAVGALIAEDNFSSLAGWTNQILNFPILAYNGEIGAEFGAVGNDLAVAFRTITPAVATIRDQMSQIKISQNPVGRVLTNMNLDHGQAGRIGVTVRASGTANNRTFYEAVVRADAISGSQNPTVELNKWQGGVRTPLRPAGRFPFLLGDVLQLCVVQNTIWIQKNGVPLGDDWVIVDTSNPILEGKPGLTVTNYLRGDDWKAYSITEAPGALALAYDPETPEQISFRCPATSQLLPGTTVEAFYRLSGSVLESDWKPGGELYRVVKSQINLSFLGAAAQSLIPPDAFVGWIVDLQPNTLYQVRLNIRVPGQPETIILGNRRTRRLAPARLTTVTPIVCNKDTFLAALNNLQPGQYLQCEPGVYELKFQFPNLVATEAAPTYIYAKNLGEVVFVVPEGGSFNIAVQMRGSHVVLENLKFSGPGFDTGHDSHSIFLGRTPDALPTDWTIRNCEISGFDCGVKIWGEIKNLTVYDCKFTGNNRWDRAYTNTPATGLPDWTWGDSGFRVGGTGNVAFNCNFSRFGDLFAFRNDSSGLDFPLNCANYMYRVRANFIGDDAFEADWSGGNCCFYDSVVTNCATAYSTDPNAGPSGFFRNTVINYVRGPLKMKENSNNSLACQNTFMCTQDVGAYRGLWTYGKSDSSTGIHIGYKTINNIFANFAPPAAQGFALRFDVAMSNFIGDVWNRNAWTDGRFEFGKNVGSWAAPSLLSSGTVLGARQIDSTRFGEDQLVTAQSFLNSFALPTTIEREYKGTVDVSLSNLASNGARRNGRVISGVNTGYTTNVPNIGASLEGRPPVQVGSRLVSSTPVLPGYVPSPGTILKYVSTADSTKRSAVFNRPPTNTKPNTFDSLVPDYYLAFHAQKIISESFSGAVANPHLGSHGALVIRGGGHRATNFNATVALVHKQNTVEWILLSRPTNWFSSMTDATARRAFNSNDNEIRSLASPSAVDSLHLNPDWGDALIAGIDTEPRPAAPHSFSMEVIIPPEDGGGTYGTLFEPAPVAQNYQGDDLNPILTLGSHKLPIQNPDGPLGNKWARAAEGQGALPRDTFRGSLTAAYFSGQKRTYYNANNASSDVMRWFDHENDRHMPGSGVSSIPYADHIGANAAQLLVVPAKLGRPPLLLGFYRATRQGELKISYAKLDVDEPTRLGNVPIGGPLYIESFVSSSDDPAWCHAAYCPITDKIYLFKMLFSLGGPIEQLSVRVITVPQALTNSSGGLNTWDLGWEAMGGLPATTQLFPVRKAENNNAPRWMDSLRCFVWAVHPTLGVDETHVYYYRPIGT